MTAASATTADRRPAIDLADHYLLLLGGALLGYAVFGKMFAYIGIPPLYIGEAVLVAGCLVALRTGCLPAALASAPSLLLVALMAWVTLRTLPFLGAYGADALRDSVVVMYGLFAFVVIALLLENGARIAMTIRYYEWFVAVFLLVCPVTLGWAYVFGGSLPFLKPTEVAVNLTGVTVFILAGFYKPRPIMWIGLAAILLMVIATSRGAMMAFVLPVCLAMVLLGRARQLMLMLVAVLAILLVGYGVETTFFKTDIAQEHSSQRSISVRQIVENAASIVTQSSEQTEGTKTWRLDWWHVIIRDTLYGPRFWTGRGFGINLADADGFWDGDHLDAPPLRSPHNGHMTILARAGVPGLALWAALLLTWFTVLTRLMLKARDLGHAGWRNLFVVVMCYVLAMLINATFDVALEGPMLGIMFWCLIGFGIASAMIYKASLAGVGGALAPRVPPFAPQT
jgi:hypothetical protein